jgi:hypothetical protein
MPTHAEQELLVATHPNILYTWDNVRKGGLIRDINTGNEIFLPATGYRLYSLGTLNSVATSGYFWSNTFSGVSGVNVQAYIQGINSTTCNVSNTNARTAMSIRCVKE